MPAQRGHSYSWLVVWLVFLGCSCQPVRRQVENINLTADSGKAILLRGAGNEWIDFVVSVHGLGGVVPEKLELRLVGLDRLGPDARWYHLDRNASALIRLQPDSGDAVLSDIPGDGNIWIDLHIPADTPAGDYHGSCQVVLHAHTISEIPITVHVYDFSIPDPPTLTVAGEVTSVGLRRLYDGHLPDSVEPLIQLCQENRLQLWFSDLQPMNHWPMQTETWQIPKEEADIQRAARAAAWQANLDKNRVLLCREAILAEGGVGAWFFPGNEFGSANPVESVLVKRLRDSEQDAEYLALAQHTAGAAQANTVANLLVRPMLGRVDPADRSLGGPIDANAFAQGKEFLASLIEARGLSTNQQKRLTLQLVRWTAQHNAQRMQVRTTDWNWDSVNPGQLNLKVGVDIYNPSQIQPTANTLEWSALPAGWLPSNLEIVPSLPSYRITHVVLGSSFDATRLNITTEGIGRLTFINGFDASTSNLKVNIPVASCDRRMGAPIIDGSLSEWSTDDLICNAPLSSSQANPPAKILANFSDTHLFLAFRLAGIDSTAGQADCQFVIQPIFADNSLGKLFYVHCKPDGVCQSNAGEGIQYACTVASNVWRGELAVPWNAVRSASNVIPRALRFNVIQRSGPSGIASWAGPVNSSDPAGAISGILILRNAPGDLVK